MGIAVDPVVASVVLVCPGGSGGVTFEEALGVPLTASQSNNYVIIIYF